MRFQAFGSNEQPLDRQRVQFPWNPDVYFNIWRSGRREYKGAAVAVETANYLRLLRLISKRKGITLKQAREGKIDLQAEIDELGLDEALELAELDGPTPLNVESIARHLVHSVDGPLILADDSDDVLGWHDSVEGCEHCGAAFLEANPVNFARWVVNEAQRIEAEFQAFMDAAAKNSLASSVPVEAEEAAAPS